MNESTTWSPGARSSTPWPTSVTMPAPSWPPSTGKPEHRDAAGHQVVVGVAHARRFHLDLDFVLCGSPISISSIDHGWLNSQISAPFVFTADLH